MCQQQQFDMSSQIEVLLKNGMPRKLGKSVEKTLRKRAEATAAKMSLNNNNNSCINCKMCGGCLNPKINFNNPCVCDNSNQLISHDEDDESASSANLSSSDESLVDSDTGFRPSRGRKASRSACPMAAMLGTRAIENSESQNQSLKTTTSTVPVPLKPTYSYQGDILAVFTQLTKKVIHEGNQFAYRVQATKTYRVLSKSTQPAHVIAVGILSFVLLAVWPNLLENEEAALRSNEKRSGLALVAYLGAFATHFGAQIWMTFVSGLALYFALPRHTFGLCQQILFPKYFAMNSMLSILTLILFIKVIAGRWEFSSYVQVIALTICAIIEVTVRLYLAPPLLRLMREKHKFEITIGSGQEIGQLEQGDLVKCPHYQGIHKAFRRIHMTVAMGNLTALVCTFLHLHYLASKISVG